MKYKLAESTWDKSEYDALERVIKSGSYTMWKEVKEFEQEFAKKMGVTYAVMSNSGSSANLLAIAALCYSGRLQMHDEIIVPAVSWSTTYFPLAQYGLKLRFVDIDKETLNMDIDKLQGAITDKTRAVMCVNLLGNPNQYDAIQAICSDRNLLLIEDNCEAMGGEFNARKLGTFGIMGTFSTFYSHHICTMEGGVTVTDDEELYHYMLCIRAHGWTRNLPEECSFYKKRGDKFYESFNFVVPGYNLRPLEIEGALGKEQLKKLDNIIQTRRKNAEYFLERMKEFPFFLTQRECGKSSWFGFSLVLVNEMEGRRDELVNLLIEHEIEVRPIVAGNFIKSPALKYMDYDVFSDTKNANYIHDNGFFLGNHYKDIREEIDYLVEVIKGAY